MAIGELDVQALARTDLRGTAEHAPLGVAHQGKATREHIVIAERVEKLGARVEAAPATAPIRSYKRAPSRAVEAVELVAPSPRRVPHEMRPEP